MRSIQAVACFGWVGVFALTAAPTFSGEPQKKEPPSTLEARLVAKTDTYKLDLSGMTSEEFRDIGWHKHQGTLQHAAGRA